MKYILFEFKLDKMAKWRLQFGWTVDLLQFYQPQRQRSL